MKMLLMHTCGVEGSVAVAEAGIKATVMLPARTFSEALLGGVRRVLEEAGWGVHELAAVVVVSGPGSFTGVRTGLSVGKGLCEALGVPLVGISRLALLAGAAGLVYAVLDAGRGEFYLGKYRDGVREMECLMGRLQLEGMLAEEARRVVVCEEKALVGLEGIAGVERVAEPLAGDALIPALARLAMGVDDVLEDANYVRRTEVEIFGRVVSGVPG